MCKWFSDEFILPLEEGFEYGQCFHLKYVVVMFGAVENFLDINPVGRHVCQVATLSVDSSYP